MERFPEADGIIASNDMVAIASYKILTNAGYRVPQDIQIIGFDNIRFSWLFTPEFTTIIQPITQMGTVPSRSAAGLQRLSEACIWPAPVRSCHTEMAGIREVAKLAGVSASTVSRVMNGTANVDEEHILLEHQLLLLHGKFWHVQNRMQNPSICRFLLSPACEAAFLHLPL